MATLVHPTALVSEDSHLGTNVAVGPYSVIEGGVVIGDDSSIGNHTTIKTGTTVGIKARIFHNCSIGEIPQDLKFGGEDTTAIIGDNVTIRESVTINRGTSAGGSTEIGNNVLLMACTHIAHDCIIGNNVIMANLATLGGHVELGDWVFLGGGVLVHQFTKVGAHVFVGGGFRIVQDVPPFILGAGEPLQYSGINQIGLRRRGFDSKSRKLIKEAYKLYFRSKHNRKNAVEKIRTDLEQTDEIKMIVDFIESSDRGII
ncbi:MAG: acyl-ACP--UDP-N-acetylglucosamine O-acyltransferase [Candidatus Marinimicrobia bacterium]|nr:acyl-[acyl-carrier-protein]--UDP-N-acetylglucosamine O-acyltransferase [Candidatus Neomarinimicrobiota bacterium]MDP6275715.1 acyl-ACP--UDP-N-acetylglucosamine O-acyltransferase [Candidatus Neomarinimicrobiota bacterium]MDP7331086.1 acyl-ACP--UDP-N-acetylglucosamine O-acyltransferase [Candidatus Neomarinimicrobiota bacterium]HJL75518.1 acyl-ACP--UDP-N-acetylglucosamine O-acyltransferase [Candidatus Neomarinimicrobiota bacterium]